MRAIFAVSWWIWVGCWAAPPADRPPPPPPPPPPAVTTPVEGPPVEVPVQTIQATCGPDQIWEMQCGGVQPAMACGPTGDALTSYGTTRVAVTYGTRMRHDATLKDFRIDPAETAIYQRDMAARGLQPSGYCCYSRCTQLVVAATAPAVTAPKGFTKRQHCIPPPAGGTSVPSKLEPSCPAAVQLFGRLVPFEGLLPPPPPGTGAMWWYEGTGCCYGKLDRKPPRNFGHCPTCKCAAAGTPIATPTGEVAIESLEPGDVVLGIDRGALRPVRLLAVHRAPARDHVMVSVTLASGRTVAMSPLHPTADGRTFADLVAGDLLGNAVVERIARVPYEGAFTYDLLPDSDTGTYVAAGALVGTTLR